MSEKIYGWMLRLYPAHFREVHGGEALQLYRDRLRDERGLVRRTRLWFDLLLDLAVSVPREYRRAESTLLRVSAQSGPDGMPGFRFWRAHRRDRERCFPPYSSPWPGLPQPRS
jgi:hypothetical protein